MTPAKVIFLDRDGTINVDQGYIYRASDWEFADRAPAGLKKLQEAGYRLAVVTNQSGIGRNYYSIEDMEALHAHMKRELAKHGVTLDAIAFCAHAPEEKCACRKPETGMTRQVEEQLGEIDYARSWIVGDKEADLKFGTSLGMRAALIRSRYWQEDELSEKPAVIVDSLLEAAKEIVSGK
jgi:D-glycero-D-manno-heptose 1,7-bisphosphate phosphatase